MTTADSTTTLRLALPKGRMQDGVLRLLADAGVPVRLGQRDYRPVISALPDVHAKLLKPQNIVEMLASGIRDVGFAGADWVAELGVGDRVTDVLDTGLDPVQVVVAAPTAILVDGRLPDRPLVVASEYERLTREWMRDRGRDDRFVHSYGATEVFPPEDADCIVDNTATGATLRANGLEIFDEVMRSSTRMFASRAALDDPGRRQRIEDLALLVRSVVAARQRVMLELNVGPDKLEEVVAALPCMREPTVSPLHGAAGFAVKAAVPRQALAVLVPELRARGGSDVVVTEISQLVE